jgi:hypothetical protein
MLGVLGVIYVVMFGWWLLDRQKPVDFAVYPLPAFFSDGYPIIRQLVSDSSFYWGHAKQHLMLLLAFLCLAKIVGTCGDGGWGGHTDRTVAARGGAVAAGAGSDEGERSGGADGGGSGKHAGRFFDVQCGSSAGIDVAEFGECAGGDQPIGVDEAVSEGVGGECVMREARDRVRALRLPPGQDLQWSLYRQGQIPLHCLCGGAATVSGC